MNVQPNAASSSIAGTARASARGGDAQSQAADAASKQTTSETPAGKSSESSAIEAGEHTSDRDADGRQMYDTFERSSEAAEDTEDTECADTNRTDTKSSGQQIDSSGHLDFNA